MNIEEQQQELEQIKRIGMEARKAIKRLEATPDYQAVRLFLQTRVNRQRVLGDYMTGQEREWNQGQCQALQFVLDLKNIIL